MYAIQSHLLRELWPKGQDDSPSWEQSPMRRTERKDAEQRIGTEHPEETHLTLVRKVTFSTGINGEILQPRSQHTVKEATECLRVTKSKLMLTMASKR